MKKKYKIILIVFLVIILLIYFGYKSFLLFNYNNLRINQENYIIDVASKFDYIDTITLNKKNFVNDYFVLKNDLYNLKIRNDFKDYENYSTYFIKKENEKLGKIFKIDKSLSVLYILKNHNDLVLDELYYNVSLDLENINLQSILEFITLKLMATDTKDIIENNNLKNDIDVIEYMKKFDYDLNIFSSIKKIKEAIVFRQIFEVGTIYFSCYGSNNITLINGNYNGYICNFDDYREITILQNDFNYNFMVGTSDYFTDEYITDLFSTLVIYE